jgi:hypothetical protein
MMIAYLNLRKYMERNRVYFKDDYIEMKQVDYNSDGDTTFNMIIDWDKETPESRKLISDLVSLIYDYVEMRSPRKTRAPLFLGTSCQDTDL